MRLLEIAMARHTLELPPWLAARMPVGADIAPAHPAIVGARIIRTELLLCIDRASASPCTREHGWRCTGGLQAGCRGLCPGGTQGVVEESRGGVWGCWWAGRGPSRVGG